MRWLAKMEPWEVPAPLGSRFPGPPGGQGQSTVSIELVPEPRLGSTIKLAKLLCFSPGRQRPGSTTGMGNVCKHCAVRKFEKIIARCGSGGGGGTDALPAPATELQPPPTTPGANPSPRPPLHPHTDTHDSPLALPPHPTPLGLWGPVETSL